MWHGGEPNDKSATVAEDGEQQFAVLTLGGTLRDKESSFGRTALCQFPYGPLNLSIPGYPPFICGDADGTTPPTGLAWCEALPHAFALDSCFVKGAGKADQGGAAAACEDLGGFLAAPHTPAALAAVSGLLSNVNSL